MLLLLSLLLFQQRDTFYSNYDAALSKLKEKDYQAAAELLEKAISQRKDSSPNAKTYGVRLEPYFPYHHLARAYLGLRDMTNARRYLNQAIIQREHQEGGELVAESIAIMNDLIPAIEEGNNTSPPPKKDAPDTEPVYKMALEDPKGALELADILLDSYPGNQKLLNLRAFLETNYKNRLQLEREQQDFQSRLEELLEQARQSEASGDLGLALRRYSNIVSIDSDNSEAVAAKARIRKQLTDQGESEAQIQKLLDLAENEKSELEQLLEQQRKATARLRADYETRLANLRKQRDTRPIVTTEPTIKVKWNLTPRSSGLIAHLHPVISADIELSEAVLLINGEETGRWKIDNQKRFHVPGLTNHVFNQHKNTLSLLVYDVKGKEYREDYDYTFQRPPKPLPMSKGFKTAVSVIICFTIGLIFFMHHSRRRKAFRERFNPYVAGAPILNEKMFYGRMPVVKQILNALHNNSLMIYGERRIGKTSFLHRLNALLPGVEDEEYEFIPVMIDLQGVREEDFFPTLDHEITLVLEQRDIVQEEPPEPPNARRFISRLRKFISMLKEQCEKKPKLVLLLDEVDVMNGFTEQTNQQLRSVFMKGFAEHIVAVMAGIHINTRWKSEGSPWYNFFEQIELKPFTRAQAEELINKPVNGIYAYTGTAVDRIMEITGGKPYLIQKMCLNLVSYILLNNKRKVAARDVDLVFKDIEKEFYGA